MNNKLIKLEKEIPTFCPANQQEWRQWLQENHISQPSVWLLCYKKASSRPSLSWSEAVDEALCFGWIDSVRKSVDNESFIQYFCKRKPRSIWSRVNKEKVEHLIKEGRMTKSGLDSIEIAKQNGSWTIADEPENLTVPQDLTVAFNNHPGSEVFFTTLSKSVRKHMLHWINMAKQPSTRQKRIAEIASLAAHQQKPKQF